MVVRDEKQSIVTRGIIDMKFVNRFQRKIKFANKQHQTCENCETLIIPRQLMLFVSLIDLEIRRSEMDPTI